MYGQLSPESDGRRSSHSPLTNHLLFLAIPVEIGVLPGGEPRARSVGLTFWGAAIVILKKDLRVEFRTKEVFNSAAVFSLLVIVTFSMAFEPSS